MDAMKGYYNVIKRNNITLSSFDWAIEVEILDFNKRW
jgi:hypothetical protein